MRNLHLQEELIVDIKRILQNLKRGPRKHKQGRIQGFERIKE